MEAGNGNHQSEERDVTNLKTTKKKKSNGGKKISCPVTMWNRTGRGGKRY